MKRNPRCALAWTAVAALGLFFLFPRVHAQEQPRRGGTVTVGIHSDLYGLNPFVRMRSIDRQVRSMVYEPLVAMDAKLAIKPLLAESWTVSPDAKEYTFNLRRGVKFHNGNEMTSEDIKWAIEYAQDPKHGASGTPLLEDIDRVQAPDRYTVKFILKRPSASLLASFTNLTTFFVVPKDSIPKGEVKVQTMLPGTGPFVFKEWRAGSHATFERYGDYWQKGLPYIDRVVLKIVPDDSARLAAVRAGDLDVMTRVPSAWISRVQRGEIKDLHVVQSPYSGVRRVVHNTVSAPFNNVKLRQAVNFALDRKKILEGAHWGIGEVTEQRFPAQSPWHFDFPPQERSLAKVKQLLKEAGYKGEKISLMVREGTDETPFIAAQLKEAGLNVEVQVLEAGAYRGIRRAGDFHMSIGGSDIADDPDFDSAIFTCDEAAVRLRQRDNNLSGYCNKELDGLFRQANSVSDYKKRYELYKKAYAIAYNEAPEIALLFEQRYFGMGPHVRGFLADGNELFKWLEGGLHKVWLNR